MSRKKILLAVMLFTNCFLQAEEMPTNHTYRSLFQFITNKYTYGWSSLARDGVALQQGLFFSSAEDTWYKLALDSEIHYSGDFALLRPKFVVHGNDVFCDEHRNTDFFLLKREDSGVIFLGRAEEFESCQFNSSHRRRKSQENQNEKVILQCHRNGSSRNQTFFYWDGTTFSQSDEKESADVEPLSR